MRTLSFKKIIRFLLLLTLTVNLNSCISFFNFTKISPPEIDIKNDDRSFQYISLYDETNLDFDNEKRIEVYNSGVKTLQKGLQESFIADSNFSLSLKNITQEQLSFPFTNEQLTPEIISNICLINSTSFLLVLESYDINYEKTIEKIENEDGENEKIANYYLVVSADFSVYNNKGLLIDKSTSVQKKFIDSREVIALNIAIRPFYSTKKEEINELSYEIGFNYINKYYPSKQIESRMYYSHKAFAKAKPYIKNENWLEAINIILPFANAADPKISKKAAHNLSVLYEAIGDMAKSDYWYNKSEEF